MGTLWSVLMGVTLLAALGIVGLILMQQGKGADLGAAMGGGASGSVFGASGSGNFLSRATAVLAAVFFVSTLALTYLGQSKNRVVQAETAAEQAADDAANVSVLERLQASSGTDSGTDVANGETAANDAVDGAGGVADSGAGTGVSPADTAATEVDATETGTGERPGDTTGASENSEADAAAEANATGNGADTATKASDASAKQEEAAAGRYTLKDGVLSVYFDSGKFAVSKKELPSDFVNEAGFAQAVKDGKKLFISGYVDSTGNAEQNRKLAADRAKAVRDLLQEAGISQDAIELQKPDAIEQGEGAAARRVEVRVR